MSGLITFDLSQNTNPLIKNDKISNIIFDISNLEKTQTRIFGNDGFGDIFMAYPKNGSPRDRYF